MGIVTRTRCKPVAHDHGHADQYCLIHSVALGPIQWVIWIARRLRNKHNLVGFGMAKSYAAVRIDTLEVVALGIDIGVVVGLLVFEAAYAGLVLGGRHVVLW